MVRSFAIVGLLCRALLTSGTPTPKPGPRCVSGTPIANQSGPVPICNNGFIVHNASCADSTSVEKWDLRSNFHVGSQCHGENDPNGLVYYKGVYHFFFQDHVEGGTVGGHMASIDFLTWRRLPVALWNDMWYDKSAVWTFSATIVDGIPVMVYPGIASPNTSLPCTGNNCMTHSVALPADPTDPWLIDWVKPDYNPIIMGTNRDPSTAWQTKAGEWRYTSVTRDIYSSWDFKTWKVVGNMDAFGGGECPDFFPLPKDCANCGDPNVNVMRPSHVHANVGYQLGTYHDGKPNSTGTWSPITDQLYPMDGNDPQYFYAAKSFHDPVKERRIVWGWIKLGTTLEPSTGFRGGECPGVGKVMVNTNSLPREAQYDPMLQRLLFFPIDELTDLRGSTFLQKSGLRVSGRQEIKVSGRRLAQSEIRTSFAMPKVATKFGVSVMTGSYNNGTRFSTDIFVDFVPNTQGNATWTVTVGYDSSTMSCPTYQRQKKTGEGPCPTKTQKMQLKGVDKTIDIAIWIDNMVVEVFFMNGRSAWTVPLPCTALSLGSGMGVFSTAAEVTLLNATAWTVDSIKYENDGPSTLVI